MFMVSYQSIYRVSYHSTVWTAAIQLAKAVGSSSRQLRSLTLPLYIYRVLYQSFRVAYSTS